MEVGSMIDRVKVPLTDDLQLPIESRRYRFRNWGTVMIK